MSRVPQVLCSVPVASIPGNVEADLEDQLESVRMQLGDRGRILVRSSGTEPVVRVMVEADDAELANDVAQQLVSAVASRWGGREPGS